MVGCAAYNCFNNSSNKSKREESEQNKKITFHKFPQDPIIRKKWVKNMRLENFVVKPHSRLCFEHFKSEDYERSPELLESLGLGGARLILKLDAVPTKFDRGSLGGKKQVKGRRTFKAKLQPSSPTKSVFGSGKVSQRTTPKRGAYEKRQRKDLITNLLRAYEPTATQTTEEGTTPPSEDRFEEEGTDDNTSNPPQAKKDSCTKSLAFPVTVTDGSSQTQNIFMSKQTQTAPFKKSKYIQVSIAGENKSTKCCFPRSRMLDKGTQVNPQPCEPQSEMSGEEFSADELNESVEVKESEADDEWLPLNEEDSPEDSEPEDDSLELYCQEKKFIVFESCLLHLFTICNICLAPATVDKKYIKGIMVTIKATCLEGHTREWKSQPEHNQMPWGNFLMAAACLFSGSQPAKLLTFFKHFNLSAISERLYTLIQRTYLLPSVFNVWEKHQKKLLLQHKEKNLTLGGDGRCDTPGHCAKYGSYTLMDLDSNKILDTSLVQSSECGGSSYMELEGLKRCIAKLNSNNIGFGTIVTDRHVQIKKYMRVKHPQKNHYFDVFHVAKSIGKEVEKIGKKKRSEDIMYWIQSIKNHVYWCASSSKGDGELVEEKWMSLFNHLINVHEGHGQKYKSCPHDEMERDWLKAGSKGYKELKAVLSKKQLVNDMKKLSPLQQTSALESYHNIVIQFAPKSTHFFYLAMKARLLLAALHFNENVDRKQAVTKHGKERWKISYPKYKKTPVAKPVKTKPTYGYISELLHMSMRRRLEHASYSESSTEVAPLHASTPALLTASKDKEDKEVVVEQHKSRFLKVAGSYSISQISPPAESGEEKQQKRCKKRTSKCTEETQENIKRKKK